MIRPAQIYRLIYISYVLVRNGLDELILAMHLFRPVRFMRFFLPWFWWRAELPLRGERIRRSLEELGPIFVKFGQNLSTRRDLLPLDIADELARLQDRVPPFAGETARAIIEKALGAPVGTLFAAFDVEPLASASIAQVHAAQLRDGRSVVVKVLRPEIEKVIRRDIALLYTIAQLADRYWPEAHRLRPVEVVAEYEKTILDELDLLREAANASQLRRNFLNSPLLYVPEIHWELTHRNVMVMERIHGTPIGDIDALRKQQIDLKALSERGVEIFFTQVFRDNFFHADMHPGNIFVAPDGQYIAVDFGIMGTLSPMDQRYLAENFLAFFNRDYHRVAELHVQSGWVPASTRIDEFESAVRAVCEPIFARPLKDISFGHLLLRLFQTARRFNMEVQPQLVLLQKTLLNIEGLGRELYPELDLWVTAKPYLEKWMRSRIGVRAMLSEMKSQWPLLADKLPELPGKVHELVTQLERGKLRVGLGDDSLRTLVGEMRRSNRRTVLSIIGAACWVSGAVVLGLDGYSPAMIGAAPMFTWVMAGLGTVLIYLSWPQDID